MKAWASVATQLWLWSSTCTLQPWTANMLRESSDYRLDFSLTLMPATVSASNLAAFSSNQRVSSSLIWSTWTPPESRFYSEKVVRGAALVSGPASESWGNWNGSTQTKQKQEAAHTRYCWLCIETRLHKQPHLNAKSHTRTQPCYNDLVFTITGSANQHRHHVGGKEDLESGAEQGTGGLSVLL